MSIVRNTGYNILGQVLPVLSSLVTVPIYLRLVGPERFGVLSLAWLLLGYFGLFDLGLGQATAFRLASLSDSPPQARADAFWAALWVNTGLGVIGGVVLYFAAGYLFGHVFKIGPDLRGEMAAAAPLLGASVPIATVTGVLTGGLWGRERFFLTNMVSTSTTLLFQLFPLAIALWWGVQLPLLLTGALAARAIGLLPLAYLCHRTLTKGQKLRVLKTEIRALLSYGVWVTVTGLINPILVVLDRFVIGTVIGANAVTVYTLPYQLGQRLAILPRGVTNAMFPRLASVAKQQRETQSETAISTLAGVFTLPVLISIVAVGPFLRIWVGPDLATQAAPVGRILFIGFWANAYAQVAYVRLQASGRPDLVAKMLLAEIPPYLLLLYFGMTRFGLVGCAVAWAVRCALDFALLTRAGGGSFRSVPTLLANGSLLVAAAFCASVWPVTDWRLWPCESVLAVLTAAAAWLFLPDGVRRDVATRIGDAAVLLRGRPRSCD